MTIFTTKKIMTAIATAAVSAMLIAPAAQARGGHAKGDFLQSRFDRIDTSGDGMIDLSEFQIRKANAAERAFNRKDRDDDGLLTLEEATTTRRGEANDYSDIAADIVTCVADKKAETGDDNIEVPAESQFQSPQDRFNDIDTSGDGLLDFAEFEMHKQAKQEQKFIDMDTDVDTFVTFEEFSAAHDVRRATRRAIRACINELSEEVIP